ncbi:hypothetical protein [Mesobacillus maritimus]|uniref:hypothetical protein n=1 Tax=Mesobacillus maritimus TaxID=1643336 RepID=UPI0038507925
MIITLQKHRNDLMKLSGILIIFGFITGLIGNDSMKHGAFLAATVIAGIPIFIKAYQALRMKAFRKRER